MSTTNPPTPQRGNSNEPSARTEPNQGKSDPRNFAGSTSSTQRSSSSTQPRNEGEILRCLDAIDESVRKCRTAMGREEGSSSQRSEPTSSGRSTNDPWKRDDDESSDARRSNPSR